MSHSQTLKPLPRAPIELVLPYPLSANRYWRAITIPGRTMMAPTKEAIAFKAQVALQARVAGIREPIAVRSVVEIAIYPQRPQDWAKRARRDPATWDDDVRCIDADNANKVLLDALRGVAIVDDSRRYVRKLVTEQMEPDGEARTVVRITPLVLETPQAELLVREG
ncbi:RusA family crossover junction endodeoxyribonuclease [Piscinibacter sakaiensis]|uniref:Uncharacterized protein n=1 Tax=Piscinibacter sakaiensis TaxID=1547922 RepID=A0A0K8P3Z2_PISS1|nr:RusA family crossover junction endodeoxyribonuclease [Piscinibacter sakaiensis]GAP37368.1 hypothetical protein ISF6_3223 [Piscinibacter sakaiensis]